MSQFRRQIYLNNLSVSYLERKGDGPLVILVHGNSHSANTFIQQFSSELLRPIHLIALDLPGHGYSAPSDSSAAYSIPYYADILSAFVQHIAPTQYILAGHSLGGHIAIEALESSDFYRSPVGLLIWGTPPFDNEHDMAAGFYPNEELKLFYQQDLNSAEKRYLLQLCYHNKDFISEAMMEELNSVSGLTRSHLAASLEKKCYKKEKTILRNFLGKVAILHGEYEKFVNLNYLQNLDILNLWKKEILIIPNAGHNCHVENSHFFNKILYDFSQDCLKQKQVPIASQDNLRPVTRNLL